MAISGYVYVLSNPSMPGLVKIGRSIHGGLKRAKEMYQTGVAAPFKLEFEMFVENCESFEERVHKVLEPLRINPHREFFRVDIERARDILLEEYLRRIDRVSLHIIEYSAITAMEQLAEKVGVSPGRMCMAASHFSEFSARHAVNEFRKALNNRVERHKNG
jgi:hypothetical protein